MASVSMAPDRTQISLWVQAIRPFAFPATIVPIIVAIAWALFNNVGVIYWELIPVILIAGILFHTGTNLVGEYFDYKKGVDRPETFGSSRILVDGLMKPKTVLYGGYASFALGFALGLILVAYHGYPMLILGIIGLIGGMFYTGTPFGYKYVALGDLFVYLMFGPLMVIGANFALTGIIDYNLFLISIPVGCLVASILIANNLRDIKHDKVAGITTTAVLLGAKATKIEYIAIVALAYVSVIVMAASGFIPLWTLLVLVSLKPAIDNIKMIAAADQSNPHAIMMGDVKSAQLHLLFGVLYTIGLVLGYYF
ncbi:MAG: 1,4-dihydroxy-2-naphthoate octaprenyltransferase [Ignavibacteriae bacterium HGW-Ignavibacteriae-1]|jgi:1,4-dihydroxy-2-naphthoate octaprenyltransferase|nr:MAG: 1,4-dihydroxy-2-naphthoate octaprenyltransferase [Ignavibacteriae bacterium HGW-Ignavibacteriae-1]